MHTFILNKWIILKNRGCQVQYDEQDTLIPAQIIKARFETLIAKIA